MTEVIRPTVIDDSVIVSSSLVESGAAAWVAGTTYGKDVLVLYNHRIWKSAAANNTGHTPGTDVTWWADQGVTNYWAMFDEEAGTRAVSTTPIVIELEPGRIDTVALLDLDAETVRVEMTVGGSTVFDETQSTNVGGQSIDNWYAWFFAPVGRREQLRFRVPPYSNGRVKITISPIAPGVQVSCGTLYIGTAYDLGSAELGVKISLVSYSTTDTNTQGVTRLVKRSRAKRNTARLLLPSARVDAVVKVLDELDATVALWIITDKYESTMVYGIYKELEVGLDLPDYSYCSLTVLGLVAKAA